MSNVRRQSGLADLIAGGGLIGKKEADKGMPLPAPAPSQTQRVTRNAFSARGDRTSAKPPRNNRYADEGVQKDSVKDATLVRTTHTCADNLIQIYSLLGGLHDSIFYSEAFAVWVTYRPLSAMSALTSAPPLSGNSSFNAKASPSTTNANVGKLPETNGNSVPEFEDGPSSYQKPPVRVVEVTTRAWSSEAYWTGDGSPEAPAESEESPIVVAPIVFPDDVRSDKGRATWLEKQLMAERHLTSKLVRGNKTTEEQLALEVARREQAECIGQAFSPHEFQSTNNRELGCLRALPDVLMHNPPWLLQHLVFRVFGLMVARGLRRKR
eukprot:2468047-Pyramimonas_sp.AAC.1